MKKVASLLLTTLVLISGCSNMGPDETAGTLIGGAGGALIGSQFGRGTGQLVGTGVGAVVGAYVGNSVGKNMDQKNRR